MLRLGCPEVLFNPEIDGILNNGVRPHSLTRAIWGSIHDSGQEIREDICSNVFLAGGSTLFKNIEERLHEELMNYQGGAKFNITASPDRRF